jgi:hypothetical protein
MRRVVAGLVVGICTILFFCVSTASAQEPVVIDPPAGAAVAARPAPLTPASHPTAVPTVSVVLGLGILGLTLFRIALRRGAELARASTAETTCSLEFLVAPAAVTQMGSIGSEMLPDPLPAQ